MIVHILLIVLTFAAVGAGLFQVSRSRPSSSNGSASTIGSRSPACTSRSRSRTGSSCSTSIWT